VRITRVSVSDGSEIPIPDNGVVLLVGPNNAGKSQFLRDITRWSTDAKSYAPKVLTKVDLDKALDGELSEWISANLPTASRDGVPHVHIPEWGDVSTSNLENQWQHSGPGLGILTSMLVLHADGKSRLGAGDSHRSIDFSKQPPSHPLQKAYIKPAIENALSGEALDAFGTSVTLDRYGGSQIILRFGSPPELDTKNGVPTSDYLDRLKALPPLEEQGDGVRSYIGLLLFMLGATQQIILVDEPEAFLHPPQARQLGKFLADRSEDKQSFIATHSADILRGVLEQETRTTIVRITRSEKVNHAAVLDHVVVNKLWSDPLLRYSNMMDGLFHDAVILCEGDADCRYYAAVLDSISTTQELLPGAKRPQLLFTHCGGKSRMASVIIALRSTRVPVVVVADFDVLKNEDDIKRIVSALGRDFSDLDSDLNILVQALVSDSKPLRKTALKDELISQIDGLDHEVLNTGDVAKLKSVIHADNGWDKAKRAGVHAIAQGAATAAGKRLLEALVEFGVLVVPVGELERFEPEVPGHGPAWVTAVLEGGLHRSPSADAKKFVTTLGETAARLADVI
jgi:hypothetical protein